MFRLTFKKAVIRQVKRYQGKIVMYTALKHFRYNRVNGFYGSVKLSKPKLLNLKEIITGFTAVHLKDLMIKN